VQKAELLIIETGEHTVAIGFKGLIAQLPASREGC
jgi:hypothetical protein